MLQPVGATAVLKSLPDHRHRCGSAQPGRTRGSGVDAAATPDGFRYGRGAERAGRGRGAIARAAPADRRGGRVAGDGEAGGRATGRCRRIRLRDAGHRRCRTGDRVVGAAARKGDLRAAGDVDGEHGRRCTCDAPTRSAAASGATRRSRGMVRSSCVGRAGPSPRSPVNQSKNYSYAFGMRPATAVLFSPAVAFGARTADAVRDERPLTPSRKKRAGIASRPCIALTDDPSWPRSDAWPCGGTSRRSSTGRDRLSYQVSRCC